MIPGELFPAEGDIHLNQNRPIIEIEVINEGDRPIQVGSHYHFYEVNQALLFEREITKGWRLNITAGTAVRFEPGQRRTIELVKFAGTGTIYGFRAQVMGQLENNND